MPWNEGGRSMPGVTQEQISAAKRIRAIDFLLQYRPDDIVPSQCRGEFQLQSHDSFKISGETSLWHWKSRDIGGKSALDYLIHVEGMRFTEAVLLLLEQPPAEVRSAPAPRQMPKPKGHQRLHPRRYSVRKRPVPQCCVCRPG